MKRILLALSLFMSFSGYSFVLENSHFNTTENEVDLENLDHLDSIEVMAMSYDSGNYQGGFIANNSFYFNVSLCIQVKNSVGRVYTDCSRGVLGESPITLVGHGHGQRVDASNVVSVQSSTIRNRLIRVEQILPTMKVIDYRIRINFYEDNWRQDDTLLGSFYINPENLWRSRGSSEVTINGLSNSEADFRITLHGINQ